jgi:hypothetical protein
MHHVSDLNLTVVRSPGAPNREAEVRRFVTEVIERAGNELDRRFPGRIFAIRELPLHWRIRSSELRSPAAIADYAVQVAAAIAELPNGWSRSPDFGEIRVFAGRPEFWASYLEARAAGASDALWPFAAIASSADPVEQLVRQSDPALTAEVLRLLAIAQPERLASLLDRPGAAESVLRQCGLPELPLQGASAPDLTGLETVVERLAAIPEPVHHAARVSLAFACLLAFTSAPARVSLAELTKQAAALARTDAPDDRQTQALSPEMVFTAFGGLFYLLNVLAEIDAGEILWTACLDERVFFRDMFLAIAGTEDPAAVLLSGAPPESVPAGSEEQCDAAIAALPRGAIWIQPGSSRPQQLIAALANSVLDRFCRNLDFDQLPVLEDLRSLLALRGRLVAEPEEVRLVLSFDAIDIRIRKAGLDRNPGWVSWLRKTVRIEFEE